MTHAASADTGPPPGTRVGHEFQPGRRARRHDELLGTVEFSLGLWDHALGVDFPDGQGALADKSVSSSLAVVPGIEWAMGRTVYLGGELVLLWVDDPYWAIRDRRLLTGLNVRARLSFPVIEKVRPI